MGGFVKRYKKKLLKTDILREHYYPLCRRISCFFFCLILFDEMLLKKNFQH